MMPAMSCAGYEFICSDTFNWKTMLRLEAINQHIIILLPKLTIIKLLFEVTFHNWPLVVNVLKKL